MSNVCNPGNTRSITDVIVGLDGLTNPNNPMAQLRRTALIMSSAPQAVTVSGANSPYSDPMANFIVAPAPADVNLLYADLGVGEVLVGVNPANVVTLQLWVH